MTTARKLIVDTAITPYYQCISHCVRNAPLFGGEYEHRKQWVEDRIQELVAIFAIDVCAFSILDSHFHVLLRVNLEQAKAWSPLDVARRWLQLCPPRTKRSVPLPITKDALAEHVSGPDLTEKCRARLCDMSWFMKSLREPVGRRCNKESGDSGVFWTSRFRSVGILDDASLLASCVAIDLEPVAAGMATQPRKAPYTSLKSRVAYCQEQGNLDKLTQDGASSRANLEAGHWLFPVEDRRDRNGRGRAGMIPKFPLAEYLQLVDWSNGLVNRGKSITGEIPKILTRLEIEPTGWYATLSKLLSESKKVGSYFGGTQRLNEVAAQHGQRFMKNFGGRFLDPVASNQDDSQASGHA